MERGKGEGGGNGSWSTWVAAVGAAEEVVARGVTFPPCSGKGDVAWGW